MENERAGLVEPVNAPPAGPYTLLPCISLWQPWAQWVSLGWKTIETRFHNRFRSLEGKRIGIHSSLKWDKQAIVLARNFLTAGQIEETSRFLKVGGAIICTARVSWAGWLTNENCFAQVIDRRGALIDCIGVRRYGLELSEVRHPEVIPCKGGQGIFYRAVLDEELKKDWGRMTREEVLRP